MLRQLIIDLNDPNMLTADPVARTLEIGRQLLDAGFRFEPVEDLFPASLEIAHPWRMEAADGKITYMQD